MSETTVVLDAVSAIYIIFSAISMLVLGPLAWIVRGSLKDLKDLERRHVDLRYELPREYVRRDDYLRDITEIKSILHQIYQKLDNKADKSAHEG